MKRFGWLRALALLSALVMLAVVPAAALADTRIVNRVEVATSISFNKATGNYIMENGNGLFVLYGPDGQQFSDAYKVLSPLDGKPFFKVRQEDGLNTTGLLDATGKLIVPMSYGEIVALSDRWVIAIALVDSPDGNARYYIDWDTRKSFAVGTADVYVDGVKVATLTGEEFDSDSNTKIHGSYLCVRKPDGNTLWLDETGSVTNVAEGDRRYDEFDTDDNGNIIHLPTGQAAFTAGCPLTADKVGQPIWYDEARGVMLDLQGNVLASGLAYDYFYFYKGYTMVRQDGLFGMVNAQGQMIIPVAYLDFGTGAHFPQGYELAFLLGGGVVYVDMNGNVTVTLPTEVARAIDRWGSNLNASVGVVELDGQYAVYTATAGVLPEMYDDAADTALHHRVVAVRKGNNWGVIDMEGNAVIPFAMSNEPVISDNSLYVYDSANGVIYTLAID